MNKKRIIIVDDEHLVLSLLKEVLEEDSGIEVSVTHKKEEFMELAKYHEFDAAVIDIRIGGKNGGMDLLKFLKENDIPLPCIMLSAHSELDYALPCLNAGAQGYVNKAHICNNLVRGLKEIFEGNLFISGPSGDILLQKYQFPAIESFKKR